MQLSQTSTIIVTFVNDSRYYTLSKNDLAKYPNCFFLAKESFNQTNICIIDNYTYEEFKIISKAISNNITIKEYVDNKEQLDYFGITPYFQDGFTEYIHDLRSTQINFLDDFLSGTSDTVLLTSPGKYIRYKKIFAGNDRIIPFQFITLHHIKGNPCGNHLSRIREYCTILSVYNCYPRGMNSYMVNSYEENIKNVQTNILIQMARSIFGNSFDELAKIRMSDQSNVCKLDFDIQCVINNSNNETQFVTNVIHFSTSCADMFNQYKCPAPIIQIKYSVFSYIHNDFNIQYKNMQSFDNKKFLELIRKEIEQKMKTKLDQFKVYHRKIGGEQTHACLGFIRLGSQH